VAGWDGFGEHAVDVEDGGLGAVVAVFGFVMALHDGEGVHTHSWLLVGTSDCFEAP
jgi:hypothetical protein